MDLMIQGVGGLVINLLLSEIYSVMFIGVFDVVLIFSMLLISYKFNEVLKFVIIVCNKLFWFMFELVLILMLVWNLLILEQKKVVSEVGVLFELFVVEGVKCDDKFFVEVYVKFGDKVVDMDQVVFDKWLVIVKVIVYKDFVEIVLNGKVLFDMVLLVK